MAAATKQHLGSFGWVSIIGNYGSISHGHTWGAAASGVISYAGVSGKMLSCKFVLSVAPGAGKARTFTLYKNGAPTGLTVTIADAATSGSKVYQVSITRGDSFYWVHSVTGVPTACVWRWLAVFTPKSGMQWFAISSNNMGGNNISPLWCRVITSNDINTTILFHTKLKYFHLKVTATPAAGTEYKAVIRKNGAAQAATLLTIVNGQTEAYVECDLDLPAGTRVQIYTDKTGAPAIVSGMFSLGFQNTDSFGYMLPNADSDMSADSAAVRYGCFNDGGVDAAEATLRSFMPAGVQVRGMYMQIRGGTNGVACTYTSVIRNNSTSSHWSCTIGAAGTGATPNYFALDVNHADDFVVANDWDTIGVMITPAGAPTSKDPIVGVWLEDSIELGGGGEVSISRPIPATCLVS